MSCGFANLRNRSLFVCRGTVECWLQPGRSPCESPRRRDKRVTSALTFADATSQLSERSKADPTFAKSIAANPSFNVRAGGVLLKSRGNVIGAIGVGGARGSENDEVCALAGVQAVQEQLAALPANR